MTLCLALRLGLGAIFGGGATPPEPSAPVFASEPGELAEITEAGTYNLGFVPATGYPSPAHVLTFTVPDGVQVLVNGSPVSSGASVSRSHVASISLLVPDDVTGTAELTLTATNSEDSDTADAEAPIDVPAAVTAPVISNLEIEGDPVAGGTVEAVYDLSGGTPDTITYEWYLDDVLVEELTTKVVTVPDDEGAYLKVKVTVSNTAGSDDATSDPIGPITVPIFSERTLYVDPDTQTDIEYDASDMVETITITAGDLPLIVEDLRVES